jgi:hypothetical protein
MNEAERAEEAQRILGNEVWQETFKEIERDLIQQMLAVKANDTLLHHRLIDSLKVLHAIEQHLKTTIFTGRKQQLKLDGDQGWLRKVV